MKMELKMRMKRKIWVKVNVQVMTKTQDQAIIVKFICTGKRYEFLITVIYFWLSNTYPCQNIQPHTNVKEGPTWGLICKLS